MTQQYMGEIRIMGFNFAPKNWAQCNGQILSIAQNQALFSLLGTTYGGNGVTTFALPDLRTYAPGGVSQSYPLGAITGEYTHTLLQTEIPQHSHVLNVDATKASTDNVSIATSGTSLGQTSGKNKAGAASVFTLYNS